MTKIETMEALHEVPIDSVLTVGRGTGAVWARSAEGLTRESFTVDLEMFEGEVKAGRVTVGARPAPGQVWLDSAGYYYVVIGQAEGSATEFWCSQHNSTGGFRRFRKYEVTQGEVMATHPDWAALAYSMGCQWLTKETDRAHHEAAWATVNNEAQRLRNEAAQRSTRELRDYKAALQADLLTLAAEQDWSYSSPLGNVMARHGLNRPPRKRVTTTLTITVNGASRVNLSAEAVAGATGLPKGVEPAAANSVIARWTKTLTHDFEHDEGEHTCGTLRRSDVRRLLVEAGGEEFNDVSFEHTTSCEACTGVGLDRDPF